MTVELRSRLAAACELPMDAIDGAVLGVPGVVDPVSGRVALAGNIPGLEGMEVGTELERLLDLPVTVVNDINLAALGEHSRGVARGVDSFAFLSVGTGLGAGIVIGGRLLTGHRGAAGELDFALGSAAQERDDPCAAALSAFAASLSRTSPQEAVLRAPFDVPSIFAAARAGEHLARRVVAEAARRIAIHVLPIAAVADVELVVLGGGIGANGDLLLAPIRERLAEQLPFPPRVEVSTLGDAAVLAGALSVGLTAALDNAFAQRSG